MTIEEHRFPCETCGSDLRFDPGHDRLYCDHCGNSEVIENGPWAATTALAELDFEQAIGSVGQTDLEHETQTTSCSNCGALVEFDGAIHAKECPYCATPIVKGTGATRQIKPRAILPFDVDETTAREAMKEWLGSLWFAPNGLAKYARKGRRLNGIYMPCWTFDADTKSSYRGQRGTVYHTTRKVRRNGKTETVRVQKIRWRRVSGSVARFFDDVLVLASAALPEKFRNGLTKWDLTQLEPYQPEYLAGFRAEAYTIDLRGGFLEARAKMDRQIRRDIKFDIGGDRQRIDEVSTQINDVTFKHILVPVWLAAYKYRGTSFRFVVNGQTGEVIGQRPWSIWKIAFAILAIATVAGTVGYFYAMSQSG